MDMQRTLHTLKGGARLAGQTRLGDLAHDFEQYLSEIQQQGQPWPESLFVDVQSAFDGLQNEIEQLRQRLGQNAADTTEPAAPVVQPAALQPLPKLDLPIIAASSQPVLSAKQAQVLPFVQRAAEAALEAEARRAPQELVKVPADLLEGLVNLAGETSIFRGRVEQQVSDVGFTLGEMEATIERVRDQLRRLDTETQAQILSRYQAETERSGYEEFDLLEMDRHSQLQQLSRALFESASDLLDLKETLAGKNRDAETLLLQQARVNTELQEGLMRTRMVPFDRSGAALAADCPAGCWRAWANRSNSMSAMPKVKWPVLCLSALLPRLNTCCATRLTMASSLRTCVARPASPRLAISC